MWDQLLAKNKKSNIDLLSISSSAFCLISEIDTFDYDGQVSMRLAMGARPPCSHAKSRKG